MSKGVEIIYKRKCFNCKNMFEYSLNSDEYYCPICKKTYSYKLNKGYSKTNIKSKEYLEKQKEFLDFYYLGTNSKMTRKDLILTKVNR